MLLFNFRVLAHVRPAVSQCASSEHGALQEPCNPASQRRGCDGYDISLAAASSYEAEHSAEHAHKHLGREVAPVAVTEHAQLSRCA